MTIALPFIQRAPQQVVLVADDEPLIRAMLCDWLTENGVTTAEAADGDQAIARLSRDPNIALVFTDVQMPKCNGLALARWVHSNRPDVVVMLASAEASSEIPGADATFFAKPYDLGTVVRCIRTELQRKSAA